MLTAESLSMITATVVALVQLVKWSGFVPLRFAPIGVLVFAALGVGAWGWSHHDLMRDQAFTYFTGWIMVALSASGVYGFARSDAAVGLFTTAKPPAP